MKRIISLLLAVVLLIGVFPVSISAAETSNPFTDVSESDYFYAPVLWAVENEITTGVSSNSFAPGQTCTRGQVVTFLWRANGNPEPSTGTNPFVDVNSNDYFYKAVLWAVENGITTGISADRFGPGEPCTRGQVVTFLWRAMGKAEPENSANPFGDISGSDYFYTPVLWAVEKEITTGTGNGKFSPADPCTRGQVVTFLHRAESQKAVEPDVPEEPTVPAGEELRREDLEITLKIPTNGYLNYYTDIEIVNRSEKPITFPTFIGVNGKLCNLYEDVVLDGGYHITLSYYRAMIPSERWDDKWEDMYLDNNSLAYMVIEWNSDHYYCEFGVNGIVEFYRGDVNGPATDPIGPDPEQPTEPTVPSEPTEPEPTEVVYYTMHPAVPDLGAMVGVDVAMGGGSGDDTYYYWGSEVWNAELESYAALIESCNFVYKDTVFGTITDRDYDIYEHATLDITVEVGLWRDNPLGNLSFVTVSGSDAGKTSSDSETVPSEPTTPDVSAGFVDPDDIEPYLTFTGYGDDVVTGIDLPAGEYYAEYFNEGDRHFSIWFYYGTKEYDRTLLANTSGKCSGQSLLEDTVNSEVIDGLLEVSASGSWTVHIKPVSGTCTTNIKGFSNTVTGRFTATNSRAVFNITNESDGHFAIWLYESGGEEYDSELLVSESGNYNGKATVTLEVGKEYYYEITSSGNWTIDLGLGDPLTEYGVPDGKTSTGESTIPGGDTDDEPSNEPTEPVDGYIECASVPDFGAFVGGVEPEFSNAYDGGISYTYLSEKVYDAAGSNAMANYLSVLNDAGFKVAGGYSQNTTDAAILVNDELSITISITTTLVSGQEYISINFYGEGYTG